tara:strand:- start:266 stop:496 length:231 start_codon:yes stop_codon:yes gene_type:complete
MTLYYKCLLTKSDSPDEMEIWLPDKYCHTNNQINFLDQDKQKTSVGSGWVVQRVGAVGITKDQIDTAAKKVTNQIE